jgi:hypothetical protein
MGRLKKSRIGVLISKLASLLRLIWHGIAGLLRELIWMSFEALGTVPEQPCLQVHGSDFKRIRSGITSLVVSRELDCNN